MTKQELIDAVKKHAQENYEKGGWDYVIECWSDDEIVEACVGCVGIDEAIKKIGEQVGITDGVRRDVIGAGGGCPDCLSFDGHDKSCLRQLAIEDKRADEAEFERTMKELFEESQSEIDITISNILSES